MKILKVLEDIELVIVDLEVSMGDKKQNAPTLCARHEGKIIPLNSAHDGSNGYFNCFCANWYSCSKRYCHDWRGDSKR